MSEKQELIDAHTKLLKKYKEVRNRLTVVMNTFNIKLVNGKYVQIKEK